MADTRSELSKKNPYYIPKERYLELKHFCKQVPDWRIEQVILQQQRIDNGLRITFHPDGVVSTDRVRRPIEILEPTPREMQLDAWLDIYNAALFRVFPEEYRGLVQYFQMALFGDESYDKLCVKYPALVRITRDNWYEMYRKFFYILDKTRK